MVYEIVFGFNFRMDYDCSTCNSKCCANEYTLPLFNFEEQIIVESFPQVSPFIVKRKNNEINELVRYNSCVFLSEEGLCIIQSSLNKNAKPLVCQVYPLMFKKFPNLLFIYQYPCKGMKWNKDVNYEKKFKELTSISKQIDKYYKNVFTDRIDEYDPFMFVDSNRILIAEKELNLLNDSNWNFLDSLQNIHLDHEFAYFNNIKQFLVKSFTSKRKFDR